MVDLFCGRGGWTKGFQAHGWDCIGIDLYPQPDYPGEFIQADLAQLLELPAADFYCCSSPCENFTIFQMPHFHPRPRWPWMGIALFEYARYLLDSTGKSYIMENVRMAERFVGRASNHCGPFYLWGSGVPAIFPRDAYKVQKGMGSLGGQHFRKMAREDLRKFRRENPCPTAAKVAEIPLLVSSHIAQMAVAAC
jgi:hypothetical protein